jgi:hypothetical protein
MYTPLVPPGTTGRVVIFETTVPPVQIVTSGSTTSTSSTGRRTRLTLLDPVEPLTG